MFLLFWLIKINHRLLTLFSILCFATATSYSAESINTPLKFVVPDFPPYTYQKNGQLVGLGIDKIKKVMALSQINYTVEMVRDYKVAMLLIKTGKADGMFLASENNERNNIATFSHPVMINRWCWFFKANATLKPHSIKFKRNAKIGTILNTNTQKWLQKNGYSVIGKPDNARALNKMLSTNRINAAFLSEAVFVAILSEEQYDLYHKMNEVEKPFGIYISNKYINNHPNIINQVNRSITQLVKQKKL